MKGKPAEEYYEVIGVPENARADAIKSAYRAAIRRWHPDVNDAPEARRFTEMLNEAYETLSDPVKRKEYDAFLLSMRRRRVHSNRPQSLLFGGTVLLMEAFLAIFLSSYELTIGTLHGSRLR